MKQNSSIFISDILSSNWNATCSLYASFKLWSVKSETYYSKVVEYFLYVRPADRKYSITMHAHAWNCGFIAYDLRTFIRTGILIIWVC